MNAAEIVGLVAELIPVAQDLLSRLAGAHLVKNPHPEVLALIENLTPIAQRLVAQIEEIRTQTEADHAAVWDRVRGGWLDAVSQWEASRA